MGPVLNPCPPEVHFPIDSSVQHIVDHLDEQERHEFYAGLNELWPTGPLDEQANGQALFRISGYLADWQISIQIAQHPDFDPDVEPVGEIDPADTMTVDELRVALGL